LHKFYAEAVVLVTNRIGLLKFKLF